MAKIDPAQAPSGEGTLYPAPHDAPCLGRRWLRLGDAAGLTAFGVWSSQRHWHMHEDEFVYVLEGELVLVTDAGETLMRSGECAGFKAGVRDGHHLQNRGTTPARFLVIGNRDDADWGEYPDIDMKFLPGRVSGAGGYAKKNGEPL